MTSSPTEQELLAKAFAFLERKYVQRSDARQKEMGLQYTTAETHDLAARLMEFARTLPPSDRDLAWRPISEAPRDGRALLDAASPCGK